MPGGGGRGGPPSGGRHGNLGLAVALQGMISAGDGLAQIALASRVYERSHAGWAVASVFLAVTVPIVLLAPAAGLLLDKVRPKPVLTAAAAAAACVMLALIRVTGIPGTLALAAGLGACAAVLQPGLDAIVPRLAPPGRITQANSYLQAATWGGMTAGPLLAGLLSAAGGTYGIGGLADGVEVLAVRSYLNYNAPEALAGRVFALYSAVMFGAASAGMAAASGLLGPLGARALIVIAGSGGIVAGTVGWLACVRRAR